VCARLQREAAGVERDRLADEPEHEVGARGGGRLVTEDDHAGLVAAAGTDRGERAHAELVDLGRAEDLSGQMLVLTGQLDGVLGEGRGIELVRRHVREVARAVRPLGDEQGPLG